MPKEQREFKRCIVCGHTPADRAHIKSKGSGGSWGDANIVPLCRAHHIQQHWKGWPEFVDLYPDLKEHLEKMGWEVIQMRGRRKLVRS